MRVTPCVPVTSSLSGDPISAEHLAQPQYTDAAITLTALAPDVLVPAHCTGWRAMHRLGARFPDAFIPSSVGTRIQLRAPAPEVFPAPAGDDHRPVAVQ